MGILREYLDIDTRPALDLSALPFTYDAERVVDDFVLLVALCGNDFMPHLPSLDIGEGALDLLLHVYRTRLGEWGGYLSQAGEINMPRLESLLVEMGAEESRVFSERERENKKRDKYAAVEASKKARLLGARMEDDDEDDDWGEGSKKGAVVGSGGGGEKEGESRQPPKKEKEGESRQPPPPSASTGGVISPEAAAAAEAEVLLAVSERLHKEAVEAALVEGRAPPLGWPPL